MLAALRAFTCAIHCDGWKLRVCKFSRHHSHGATSRKQMEWFKSSHKELCVLHVAIPRKEWFGGQFKMVELFTQTIPR
jgi:hypothetical protein